MTKHTSQSIPWDDQWQMIQVKRHDHSGLWVFFAMINKDWYYGEGTSIQIAMENCERKISWGLKAGKANIKEKLEELF